jgi:TPR repeat protein
MIGLDLDSSPTAVDVEDLLGDSHGENPEVGSEAAVVHVHPGPSAATVEQKPSWNAADAPRDLHEQALQIVGAPGKVNQAQWHAAVKLFMQAANGGCVEAMFRLADCYSKGHGIDQDAHIAAEWYEKAAERQHVGSQAMLAVCYELGRGVPQDESKASYWYMRAADGGSMLAQYNLGVAYQHGDLLESVNYELATKWYKRSATQGYTPAICALGVCYYNGWTDPSHSKSKPVDKKFIETAIGLFKKASTAGYPPAHFALGVCYLRGQVKIAGRHDEDTAKHEALHLLRKAAKKGHPLSQYLLGVCYEIGSGVKQDEKKAHHWFKHAASRGIGDAQYATAMQLEMGAVVETGADMAAAAKMLAAAAENQHGAAYLSLAVREQQRAGKYSDPVQTLTDYQLAADKGIASAMYAVAREEQITAALRQLGKEKDMRQLAAESKHGNQLHSLKSLKYDADMEHALGHLHRGTAVPSDAQQQRQLAMLQKAAANGEMAAALALGGDHSLAFLTLQLKEEQGKELSPSELVQKAAHHKTALKYHEEGAKHGVVPSMTVMLIVIISIIIISDRVV